MNIFLYDNLKKILVVVVEKKENENKEKRLLLWLFHSKINTIQILNKNTKNWKQL